MKNYNIFIRDNERKELLKLKKQYHLSISCIVRQIYNCTITWTNKTLEKELLFNINTATRTSINTNFKKYLFLNYKDQDMKKIQTVLSNAIYLYFNKDKLAQILNKEETEETFNKVWKQYHNSLHALLKTEKDKFYDYQQYALNEARAKREFKRKGNKQL